MITTQSDWAEKELSFTRRVLRKKMCGSLAEHFEDAVQFILLSRLEGRLFPSIDQLLVDYFRANRMGSQTKTHKHSISPNKWRETRELKPKHSPKYFGDYDSINLLLDLEKNFDSRKKTIGILILMGFTYSEISKEFGLDESRIAQLVGEMRLEDEA